LTVPGAPERELGRSTASMRVGELAAAAGLLQFHFEHRVHLGLPETWVPAHQPERADPPVWADGALPERKYQSFRHDLAIGSFHPMHRGKWTAHELCHGLVGFAWQAGASPFFHATAGRLAELLPVALWYWFDEADRVRCPLHEGGGALFRAYCRECDQMEGRGELRPEVLEQGRAFVAAELDAIGRSVSAGVVSPHRYATLDLSSDGVAYAQAHGPRLASPGFAAWIERFAVRDGGWCDSLDALQARVSGVADALLDGTALAPLAPSPVHGRWRWILQDVAWRIEVVRSQCDRQVAAELNTLLDGLAAATPATIDETRDARAEVQAALSAASLAYQELDRTYELLPPTELFAVGYPLAEGEPGSAGSRAQMLEGLRTCSPASVALSGVRADGLIEAVIQRDWADPRREALADRWAEAVEAECGPGDARSEVARYEAAVAVAPGRIQPPLLGTPRFRRWRMVPGARVLQFSLDVPAIAAAVAEGRLPSGHARPMALVVTKSPSGEALVAEIEPGVAEMLLGLGDGGELPMTADVVAELQQIGAITPVAYVV